MVHKLIAYGHALPFVYEEKLKRGDKSEQEVGKAARESLRLSVAKGDSADIAISRVISAAKRGYFAGVPHHVSFNAAKYAGLRNVHGDGISYTYVTNTIKALLELDLISFTKGSQFGHVHGTGQSTFIGTESLCMATEDFGQAYVDQPKVRMKEVSGTYSTLPTDMKSDEIHKEVDLINSRLKSIPINFAQCGRIQGEVLIASEVSVSLPPIAVTRVFEQGRFDHGGLLHCRTYQSLKREERGRIRIDGAEVVEISFQNLIATLYYHKVGAPVPDSPYAIQGFEDALSAVAFEACVNATDIREAIREIQRVSYLDKVDATTLIIGLGAKHAGLEPLFWSGLGSELCNSESNMMIDVTSTLFKADIGCLPLRTSIIVPKAHENTAKDLILQCFDKAFPSQKIELSTD